MNLDLPPAGSQAVIGGSMLLGTGSTGISLKGRVPDDTMKETVRSFRELIAFRTLWDMGQWLRKDKVQQSCIRSVTRMLRPASFSNRNRVQAAASVPDWQTNVTLAGSFSAHHPAPS
jgi:hypothetical protein